jgi:hypothetical protein
VARGHKLGLAAARHRRQGVSGQCCPTSRMHPGRPCWPPCALLACCRRALCCPRCCAGCARSCSCCSLSFPPFPLYSFSSSELRAPRAVCMGAHNRMDCASSQSSEQTNLPLIHKVIQQKTACATCRYANVLRLGQFGDRCSWFRNHP